MRPFLLGTFGDSGIHQQVIDLTWAQLLQGLLRKRLHALEAVELTWQDSDGARSTVVPEGVVVLLSFLRVTGTEDDLVGLSLLKELLHSLEALYVAWVSILYHVRYEEVVCSRTSPEVTPAATIVFAAVAMI